MTINNTVSVAATTTSHPVCSDISCDLSLVSFNLHGFNQGSIALPDLIDRYSPDIFLVQEHWLTPANLSFFDRFSDYFSFGTSAMASAVESGMLTGRPFGGVMCLIKTRLRARSRVIHCTEKFAIISVDNYIIVNVYMPCSGTANRFNLYNDIMCEICVTIDNFNNCNLIFAGDLNVDLDTNDPCSNILKSFFKKYNLCRGDVLFLRDKKPTYVNESLQHSSCIDYMLSSSAADFLSFRVIDDLDNNFSDHLPIIGTFRSKISGPQPECRLPLNRIKQLRWDRADLQSYYYYTRDSLQPIWDEINDISLNNTNDIVHLKPIVDKTYFSIVSILSNAANLFVPLVFKNALKFWWDEELDLLKISSCESHAVWVAAGKPRQGPIFDKRNKARYLYRSKIREHQKMETETYTNELHDALSTKQGSRFWKCWRSKFNTASSCTQVENCIDPGEIAAKFRNYFSKTYTANDVKIANNLREKYVAQRAHYCGLPVVDAEPFTSELVSRIIDNLGQGKAADLNGLSAEHLVHSFPSLSCILAKLFNIMLFCRYVPVDFGRSYTVPLPKVKNVQSKALSCSDFRGIAISSVISKLFENCILDVFQEFLCSSDNQFGFKKGLGCTHAIHTVRKLVENMTRGGSTVNICAIDVEKAFDKTNHHGLLLKLIGRNLPACVVDLLEFWLKNCISCVKWCNEFSDFFKIEFGVRQGSVLSPTLFSIYLDDIFKLSDIYNCIIFYADDILILSSSLCKLQNLFSHCETELAHLDMSINVKKSFCLRIGPRFNSQCTNIVSRNGNIIPWVAKIRYLGIYLKSSISFRCCLDESKKSFYRAINAIFGRVGRIASEDVVLYLMFTKCLPILLYATEVLNLTKGDISSLDFTVVRFLMKLFKTSDIYIIKDCLLIFGYKLPSEIVKRRVLTFCNRLTTVKNIMCHCVV